MPPTKRPKRQTSHSSSSNPATSSATSESRQAETVGLVTLLTKIDMRLTRLDQRLRKVEARSRTAKIRIPKPKEVAPEELYVGDIFPRITDNLEQWNRDRRELLKAEEPLVQPIRHQ